MKPRLYTPGPTEIPEAVRLAAARAMPYHRSPEFRDLLQRALADLQYFFQTSEEVVLLTASATGGMEACVCNLCSPGDLVVVLVGGKFGERWAELGRAYGLQVVALEYPWGQSPDPEALRRLLARHGRVRAVFCTHSETSTGALADMQSLAAIVRQHSDALMVVDGVTSVGVVPCHFEQWGLDACVAGSQKGAMAPPGLAFVALSARAWERHAHSTLPRYYFDFTKARAAAQTGGTAWTPAIPTLMALAESLQRMRTQGLEHYWQHYARLAAAMRAGMQALGMAMLPDQPTPALTAVKIPEGIDGRTLVRRLREQHGVVVAGGQGPLQGKLMRVTHMGNYDHLDMVALLAATEAALAASGWPVNWGASLAVWQRTYHGNSGNE